MISTKIIDSNCMSIFKLMQPNKEAQKHKEYTVFACIWPFWLCRLGIIERKKGSWLRRFKASASSWGRHPKNYEKLRGRSLIINSCVFYWAVNYFVPLRLRIRLSLNKQQVARIRRMNDIIEAKTQETKWFPAGKDTERVWIGKLCVFMQRIIASCLCVFVFGW